MRSVVARCNAIYRRAICLDIVNYVQYEMQYRPARRPLDSAA